MKDIWRWRSGLTVANVEPDLVARQAYEYLKPLVSRWEALIPSTRDQHWK